MEIKALLDQKGAAVAELRSLSDRAEAEKRDLTADEKVTFDKIFTDIESLTSRIERSQKLAELEREAATRTFETMPEKAEAKNTVEADFRHYLTSGEIRGEMRALQADSSTAGGYTLAPQQFVAQLLKNVDDAVFIRQYATKQEVVGSDSLGLPYLANDPADWDWTTELLTGTEDSTMSFGKRELKSHPIAKRIKVSKKLLNKSALPIEQIVNERMAYKFAISMEKAYLTGSGAGQPLGLFTASTDGIPTTRDVSTGNDSTSIQFDGLMETLYSVKSQYMQNGVWLFHRDGVKQIAKLKDGEGQYLWQPAVKDGEFDTIKGRPVLMSEYVPNTFTTGQYVGLFGDLSKYYVLDSIQIEMQRLVELYAESNQVGFIGRYEGDGMPVLSEAFARVKLG